MAKELAPMLTLIYQTSLHQGTYRLEKALVIRIYIQKGERFNPEANYRPIFRLTCIVCKILEHITYIT